MNTEDSRDRKRHLRACAAICFLQELSPVGGSRRPIASRTTNLPQPTPPRSLPPERTPSTSHFRLGRIEGNRRQLCSGTSEMAQTKSTVHLLPTALWRAPWGALAPVSGGAYPLLFARSAPPSHACQIRVVRRTLPTEILPFGSGQVRNTIPPVPEVVVG